MPTTLARYVIKISKDNEEEDILFVSFLWRILSPHISYKQKKREKRENIRDYGILLESDVRRRTRKRRRDDDEDEEEEEEGKKKRKLGSDNFLPDNFKIRFEVHDAYLVFYKPILFGSSSINFVGSRPKISPVAPFHSPTRMPQSLCVSITTSPTGYAMHNSVKPSFCSSSSKVNSRSVISDWSVSPETHFATHALFIIVWKKRELYFRCVSV